MLGGKGKGGRVGQRESPSGTEVSPCLRVANLQKIFFYTGRIKVIRINTYYVLSHPVSLCPVVPSVVLVPVPVLATQRLLAVQAMSSGVAHSMC
jgi:hypothetical protein